MLTKDAVKFFGSRAAINKALGLHRTAAYQWKRVVPMASAYRLELHTGGALKVDPKYYRGGRVLPKYQVRKPDVSHGVPA